MNKLIHLTQFSPKESKLKSSHNAIVQNESDAISSLNELGIDIYITTICNNIEIITLLNKTNVKIIFWVHNYLFYNAIKTINSLKNEFRIVFCGKQFYDRYIDHPIIESSAYIYNMIPKIKNSYTHISDEKFNITFIGAIIPSKGFHYVAKAWKKIIKKIPNAKLYVIGSGALYSSKIALGKYSLAEEPYESYIINHLISADSDLNSVEFCGVLDEKKKREVISKTQIGIVNPSARTETFGISSTDFQQQNVPVVIRKKNGLLDTFSPNVTGLGFNFPSLIHRPIIKLYKNKSLRDNLASNGAMFINEKFQIEESILKWLQLLFDLENSKKPNYSPPNDFIFNNFKFIRIFNRILRLNLKMKIIPSIIEVESKVYDIIKFINIYFLNDK